MFTLNQKEVIAIGMIAAFMLVAAAITLNPAEAFKFSGKDSQTTGATEDCGNGDTPVDVFCQDLQSQIDGEGNVVIVGGHQSSD